MKPFKIPLQSEVEKYIKEKKGWPEKFCAYYADRFYNFYMSNGWKVSGKAAMKDWKAAFNSQWQTLKFKEDIDAFNKMNNGAAKKETMNGLPSNNLTDVQKVDALLELYSRNPSAVRFEALADWYDWLRGNKLLKNFSKDEVEMIRAAYNGEKVKCRSACVQKTLEGYVNAGINFSKIIEMRKRLK